MSAFLAASLTLAAFICSLFYPGGRDLLIFPAFIAMALLGGLALCKGRMPPLSALSALTLAYFLLLTLAALFSTVPGTSLRTWFAVSLLPLSFFAFSSLEPASRKAAGLTLAGAVVVLGLWGFAQVTLLAERAGARPWYPLANANHFAILIYMTLLPLLGFWLNLERRAERVLCALAVCLLAAGLLATQSRAGLVLSGAALLAFMAAVRPPRAVWLCVGGAGLAGALAVLPALSARFSRLAGIVDPEAQWVQGVSDRLAIWGSMTEMIAEVFPGGYGLGTYFLYYPPFRDAGMDRSSAQWGHLDALQLWAECGPLALVIFYAMLAAVAVTLVRLWRQKDSQLRPIRIGAALASLAVFAHSHVSYPFYAPSILIAHGFLLALLSAQEGEGRKWPGGVRAVAALWLAVLVLGAGAAGAGLYYTQQAERHLYAGRTEAATASLETARRFAPSALSAPDRMEIRIRLKQLSEDKTQKNITALEALAARLERQAPPDPLPPYVRGQLARAQGGDGKAHFREALARDPFYKPAQRALEAKGK